MTAGISACGGGPQFPPENGGNLVFYSSRCRRGFSFPSLGPPRGIFLLRGTILVDGVESNQKKNRALFDL